MRRSAALFALAALSWSQLAAVHCDMGASTPMLDAAPRTFASAPMAGDPAHRTGDPDPHASALAHHDPTRQPAPPATRHHDLSTGDTTPAPHGEHHGDGGGCLMILASCGAASARTVRATILARVPAVSVRANLYIAPIPVAVSMGVETPPPRHHA